MDPNTTLHNLLSELADDNPNRAAVKEYLEYLYRWVDQGGFLPTFEMEED